MIEINASGHHWMECTVQTATTWATLEIERLRGTGLDKWDIIRDIDSRIRGTDCWRLGVI